eukprot:scaffold651_cov252-Pinguiococcus_pyrenoidosus.AAC.11
MSSWGSVACSGRTSGTPSEFGATTAHLSADFVPSRCASRRHVAFKKRESSCAASRTTCAAEKRRSQATVGGFTSNTAALRGNSQGKGPRASAGADHLSRSGTASATSTRTWPSLK